MDIRKATTAAASSGLLFFYWHHMLKDHEWLLKHGVYFVDPDR